MEIIPRSVTQGASSELGHLAVQAALLTIDCARGEPVSRDAQTDLPGYCIGQRAAYLFYVPAVCGTPGGLADVAALAKRSRSDAIIVRVESDRTAARSISFDIVAWRQRQLDQFVGYLPCLGGNGDFYLVPAFGDYGALRLTRCGIERCDAWPFDEPGDCDLGIASAANLFRRSLWGI